jgi:acetyl esterase/lipase
MHRLVARLGTLIAAVLTAVTLASTTGLASAGATSAATESQTAIQYGPEPFQVLDLHMPDAAAFPGRRPLIMYVHAGGWVSGERTAVPEAAMAQVARGYALATIDYRLATVDPDGRTISSFPGVIWDVKRAIRFAKSNAKTWHIDPRRVVLMGASAGGHLAAFVGATRNKFEPPDLAPTTSAERDSSVRGVVDWVGPTDLVSFPRTDHPWAAPLTAEFLGCAMPTPDDPVTCPGDVLTAASVATWVDRSDPPIYLAYGAQDELVCAGTQGEPLARAWLAAHGSKPASTSYQVVETAGHTLPLEDTLSPLTEFLDRVSRNSAPRREV